MNLSRRQMMLASLAGLGVFVTGCGSTQRTATHRPTTQWPATPSRPAQNRAVRVAPPPSHAASPNTTASAAGDSLNAIARTRWAAAGPIAGRVNPMNGISRITVHHEGWTSFYHTDLNSTADRIEQIRQIHVRDRGWGDIGYHYIIDRAGRVWQARDIRHQGAHVSGHNEHNIGVMLLGNFEQQTPSGAQINRLVTTLRSLMHSHNVPTRRVYTHQELSPSACPGRNLQPRMVSLRQSGHLA